MTSDDENLGLELTAETAADFEHLKADPEKLKCDPDSEVWEKWQGAVLLKDEIRRYCKDPIKLIVPFEDKPEFLKPSSYHLRLGNKYRVNGVDYELSGNNRILKIPPHGIAIVRTLEWVNIPGFLIGRWNLKVKVVYKGLIWVGSLQVDSGYQGFLFCHLYNLSNRVQELVYKDPIFTIDFVRTTRFDEKNGCELWHSKRPTYELGELDVQRLTSAPAEQFKKMREDIGQMSEDMHSELKKNKTDIERFQSRIDSFQGITFAVLGIIVAALSFVSVSQFTDMSVENPSGWQITTWIVVLVAILVLTGTLAYSALKILRRK
jgi:deoxycytidine triphosphate deaminase